MPFKSSPEHTPRNALQCFSFDFTDNTVYQRVLQRSCGSQYSQQETGLTFNRQGPNHRHSRHSRARSSGLRLDAMNGSPTNTSSRNSQTQSNSRSPQNSQLDQHTPPYSISPKNIQQPQPPPSRHPRIALQPSPTSHSASNPRLNIRSSPSTHLPLNPNPATHLSPPSYLPPNPRQTNPNPATHLSPPSYLSTNPRQTIHPSPPFHQTPHPRLAHAPTQPPHSPFLAPSPIYPDSHPHFPSHQDMPEQSAVARPMVVIRRAPKSCPPSSPSTLMTTAVAMSGKKKKFFDDACDVSEPKMIRKSAMYQADGKQTFKQIEQVDEYESIPVLTLQQPPKGKMKRHLSSDSDSFSTTSPNSSLSLNSSVNSETRREVSNNSQGSPGNVFTEQLSTLKSPKRLKSDPRHEGLSVGFSHQFDSQSWTQPGIRSASFSHTPPRHGQRAYDVSTQRSPLNRRVATSQEGFPLARHTLSSRQSPTPGFLEKVPNQPSNTSSTQNDCVRLLESPRDDKPRTSPKRNRENAMSYVSHSVNKSASCINLADYETTKYQQLSSRRDTTMKTELQNGKYQSDEISHQRGKERDTLRHSRATDPARRRENSSESRRENKSAMEKRNSREPDIFIFPDVSRCDEVDGFDDPMDMDEDMDYSEQHRYNYGSVSGQKSSHWNNEGQQGLQYSSVYQYGNSGRDSRQQVHEGYAHQRITSQMSYMGHSDVVWAPTNTTFDTRTMAPSNQRAGGNCQNVTYMDEHDSGSSRGNRIPKPEVGVMKTPRENRVKASVGWLEVLDTNDNDELHFDEDSDQFNEGQGRKGLEYAAMQRRNDLNNNRGFNRVTSGQGTQFRADNSGVVNTRADTNVRFISQDELSGSDMSCDDMDEYDNWSNDDDDGRNVYDCVPGGVQRRGQGRWDETDGSGANQNNKHAKITGRLRKDCSKEKINSSKRDQINSPTRDLINSSTRDLTSVNSENDHQNSEVTEKRHVSKTDTNEACNCDSFDQHSPSTKQTQAQFNSINTRSDLSHTSEIQNVSSNQVLYNDRKPSKARAECDIVKVHGHQYTASNQHESIKPFNKNPQNRKSNLLGIETSRSMMRANKGEQLNVSGDIRGKRKVLMKHDTGLMNTPAEEICARRQMNPTSKGRNPKGSQHKREPHRNRRAMNAMRQTPTSDNSGESGDEVDGLGDGEEKQTMSGNIKQKEPDDDVVHIFGDDDDDDDEAVPTKNVVDAKPDLMSPVKVISMLSRKEALKTTSGERSDGAGGFRKSYDGTEGIKTSHDGTKGSRTSHDGTKGSRKSYDGTEGIKTSHDGTKGSRTSHDGTKGSRTSHDGASIQVLAGSLPIPEENYSSNNQANNTSGNELLEFHPERETYVYRHKGDSRNGLSEDERNYSVNQASSSVAPAKGVDSAKSVIHVQGLHDINREGEPEFLFLSQDDMTLSLTAMHHSKAEFARRSSDVTVRVPPKNVIPRTRSSPSKLGNDSCENLGAPAGTHQFHRPWISPPSAGTAAAVGFSTPSSTVGFSTSSSTVGFSTSSSTVGFSTPSSTVGFSTPSSTVSFSTPSSTVCFGTPSRRTDSKGGHYFSSNYEHDPLDSGVLRAQRDVIRQEPPCLARDHHSIQQVQHLSDSNVLVLDVDSCSALQTDTGPSDISKTGACLTPDPGTELCCQSCPTRSRDEGKPIGSGRKRTQVERRLFFEDVPDEATSGAQQHAHQHVINRTALLNASNGQRGKRKSTVNDVALENSSPFKEFNGQQLGCAFVREGASGNEMTPIDAVNRELQEASRPMARNVDDRPRRDDEVDISIQVSDVMEETRGLLLERLEQIHQANDNRCECARIEQDILQKALDMFRSLCDPNIVHENWHTTLRETNQVIRDSLDIAESYRQLCNHGRSVTGVFEGSVIIRVKCKTLWSVLDLCAMQRSGELQVLIYRLLCSDVTLKGKTLRVSLESKNIQTCTEFLLKTLKRVQLKKMVSSPRKQTSPTKRAVRSTDNLLLSPTSPCPTNVWSNGRRSSSTPALSSGSPLASLSSNTTPVKRERTFSFGETARIAFQELNLTEKDSPTSPFGSTSRLTCSPNIIMSPRALTASPHWLVTSPHLRTSPGTSPISSPRKLKRCDVIQEQENMADGLP